MLKVFEIVEQFSTEMTPEEFVSTWQVRPSFIAFITGCSEETAKHYCFRKGCVGRREAPSHIKRLLAIAHQKLSDEKLNPSDLSFFAR